MAWLAMWLGNQEHCIDGQAAAGGEATLLLLGGEEGEERAVVDGGGRVGCIPHHSLWC